MSRPRGRDTLPTKVAITMHATEAPQTVHLASGDVVTLPPPLEARDDGFTIRLFGCGPLGRRYGISIAPTTSREVVEELVRLILKKIEGPL